MIEFYQDLQSHGAIYVYGHLSGLCRRRTILDLFDEKETEATSLGECCDVCRKAPQVQLSDYKKEMKVLINALDEVGCKGEVKVAEWIRGSNISWTDSHNKKPFSYGNHCGKSITFWRTFIKQCHVLSLISFELKSMIKGNGSYAVHGIYYLAQKGRDLVQSDESVMLPVHTDKATNMLPATTNSEPPSCSSNKEKRSI